MNHDSRLANGAILTALIAISLLILFPLYYVVAVSFTEPSEYIRKGGAVLFPEQFTLLSYKYILSNQAFIRSIGTSAFLATVGTACSLVATSMLAYALSRRRLWGRRLLMLMILITLLFNPGIIPPYLLVRELGLINNIWSLIIPVLTSGWYVILMKGFFDSIPTSLEESASIDGCNDVGIWLRIMLPLSLPAMAAFGLFYAVAYWNTFFTAVLYINDFHKWPMQIFLQNMLIDASATGAGLELAQEQKLSPETLKMAAVVVATLPILAVYPFLQKHFAKGAIVGSVKE